MSIDIVQRAAAIAKEGHEGQLYGDLPYIVHPRKVARVAFKLGYRQPELQAACYLHDLVEDTDYEIEDLRREGMPAFTLAAVEAVSFTKEDEALGLTKAEKARQHIGGHVVKLCDGTCNLENNIYMLDHGASFDSSLFQTRLHRYASTVSNLIVDLPTPEQVSRAVRAERRRQQQAS